MTNNSIASAIHRLNTNNQLLKSCGDIAGCNVSQYAERVSGSMSEIERLQIKRQETEKNNANK